MNRIANRAPVVILLVLVLIFGLAFFLGEYLIEGEEWIVFSGSPHVYNGLNIGTGVVTDRDGILLLDMSENRVYSSDEQLRRATLHLLGDRDGYIGLTALGHYAREMAGYDSLNGVYSYGGAAGTARLTVSAQVQMAALEAMDGYKGTVAVYNYRTGEILCLVTTPTFDPDDVPDIANDDSGEYEGVYLNRFLQSGYTPGSIFKVVTAAAAMETLGDLSDRMYLCEGSYQIGSDEVICMGYHGWIDLKTAMEESCNCAFAQVVEELGAENLTRYVEQMKVVDPISFDGMTTADGNFDISDASDVEIAWSGIGQYTDLVNPCRFMTLMGAIAGGGSAAEPYLVAEIKSGNSVTYTARKTDTGRLISSVTASVLQDYLRNNVESNYGSDNFPGLTVCAKSGTGEVGYGETPNAMFAGFVLDEKYPLAFVAAVENGGYGSATCVPIMSQVLSACVRELDESR